MKIIIAIVLISSLGVSLYFLWSTTVDKEDQKSDMLKIGIPLLIPFFSLLILLFSPQKVTQVIVPELEKKIEENKQLKNEVKDLNSLIADQEKEQKSASEKIKELSDKNYAELSQATLVIEGLEKKDSKGNVATVNNTIYFGENILNSILDKEITYDPEEKKIYVGGTDNQITKTSLSDSYSILYSGERFISLEDVDEEYSVAGKTIDNGFILNSSSFYDKGSYILMNVDSKYSSIEFDVGKLDSKSGRVEDGKLKIELDGVKKYNEVISAEISTNHYTFDISGSKTLKINVLDSGSEFGFYNIILNK